MDSPMAVANAANHNASLWPAVATCPAGTMESAKFSFPWTCHHIFVPGTRRHERFSILFNVLRFVFEFDCPHFGFAKQLTLRN